MICSKCNEKNLYKAHYCKKCGNPFTEEERNEAYNKTIYGKFNKVEEVYSYLSLDKITGNMVFKVVSILLILGFGIYNVFTNGSELKILASEQYEVQYNTKTEEYYLISSDNEINVSLYIPKEAKEISVNEYNENKDKVNVETYSLEDAIILENSENYYEIEANYTNDKSEKIVVKVYGE